MEKNNSIKFLEKYNLWYIQNKNSKATSCKDAAYKRKRLGSRGIPLYDELKSMAAKTKIDGEIVYVFAHCRANAYLDLNKVSNVLGSTEIERLSIDELKNNFNAEYGTVNPFQDNKTLVQIFDKDIFNFYTAPHTLITNGGEFTISIEFNPSEIIKTLKKVNKKVLKTNIIQEETKRKYDRSSIGIITGNGPDSGMFLWKQINDRINDKLSKLGMHGGDLSYPRVIVNSIPEMGLSMELEAREDEVWNHLKEAVHTLCRSNIHYLTLACHTTQYFEEEIKLICTQYNVIFYSMVDVVEEYIEKNNLKDLTVFAIPAVSNLGEYSAYGRLKKNKNIEVTSMKSEVEGEMQSLGYHIKTLKSGEKDPEAINRLRSLIKKGTNGENALIALTELSITLEKHESNKNKGKSKFNLIDGLQLYAEKMANVYLETLPRINENHEDEMWENC
ncbi:MAG: Aspartate/glutamate racemase [uncultured Sulfurovum sp.]|uniref:Aspartate/glutamate racemase n=1 Tax=uncultured Sulfurovum sp. TaxID=269237 RepID=A0A6S6TYE8_9BACT|nr:MAG: Aspartate/glutamate racemase [uncultured Sulfurovum sp.]